MSVHSEAAFAPNEHEVQQLAFPDLQIIRRVSSLVSPFPLKSLSSSISLSAFIGQVIFTFMEEVVEAVAIVSIM